MIFKSDKNLILQYIKQHKKNTLFIVGIGILANILTILIPVSIGKYYQLVFHLHPHRVRFLKVIPDSWWNTVPKFLLFFLGLISLRFLFYFLYEYLLRREAAIFIKEIKDYLFRHQLYIQPQIYKDQGTGKYLLRYSGDINSLKNLYVKGTIRIVIDSLMILIALWWLYKLNHAGAIAILVLSLFFYGVLRLINKKVEYYSLKKRNKTSGQLAFVSRTLQSILNIIALNKQKIEHKKYRKRSEYVKQASIKYNKWFVINKAFISFVQYFILSVVLYLFFVTKQTTNNAQSNLISFILLYITILPVIRRMFMIETVYKLGHISLRKLKHILSLSPEAIYEGKKLKVKNPVIQFEKVKFPNAQTAINFKAYKQQLNTLALPANVSSLDLILPLLRIQENYSGKILINKTDIKDFSPYSVRQNIAIASTHLPFTGKTVYEAITKARSNKIRSALDQKYQGLKAAFNLNLNLDDSIGENGLQLTQFQKEFLALARGLLQDKPILIIDEFPLLSKNYPKILEQILKEQKGTILSLKLNNL